MIIHNPILTGSFTVNGTDVSSITSSAASLTSLNSYTASQNNRNGTYATTGSNTFAGIQTVNSNLVVTGSITAQTLVVQTVTSSVVYSSGSNVFGNNIANTHQFTGSIYTTGSVNIGTSSSVASVALNILSTPNAAGILINNSNSSSYTGFRIYNDQVVATRALEIDYAGSSYPSALVTDGIVGESAVITTTGAYPLQFGTSNTFRMALLANGNLGIGTTTPGSILHVKGGSAGGASFGAELRVWENAFGAVLQGSTVASTQAFLGNFRYNFVSPSISVTNYLSAGHGILFYDGIHIFASNPGGSSGGTFTPAERLTILNSGYVGIGTNNPTSPLYVVAQSDSIGGDGIRLGNSAISRIWNTRFGTNTDLTYNLDFFDGASWSNRLKLTYQGVLTVPSQVSFKAYLSANINPSKGTNVTVPYNIEEYDTQGNFSTSTYKFTAPVAGKYLFTVNFNAYSLDDTAYLRVMLIINASTVRTLFLLQNMPTGNTGDISISGADILNLAVGNTVEVRVYTDGTGTFGMSQNLDWNSFSGHLLG